VGLPEADRVHDDMIALMMNSAIIVNKYLRFMSISPVIFLYTLLYKNNTYYVNTQYIWRQYTGQPLQLMLLWSCFRQL
jgi:hypothetical protein